MTTRRASSLETAVIGDGCTLFHGVTLGGTGKIRGDRHPKLGKRVVVGNASILGNVKVADDCKLAQAQCWCTMCLEERP